ncbi:MAG: M56 family metallopeptidase [bacterium]
MFEWLSSQYVKLILNYQILLGNPSGCGAVELLRLFTFTLGVILVGKLFIHVIVFSHLKRRFPKFSEGEFPDFFSILKRSAEKVQLVNIPPIFQFSNERPLVFTIGSLRPAIFLAPRLVEKLQPEELEAALIHEFTHIKRRDNLLIWFLEIFFLATPLLIVQVFAISFIFSIENSVYAILGTLAGLTIFKAFIWQRILYLRELSCDDLSVDKIKDPLILAASLTNVWRIGKKLPKYRWQRGLSFAQTLLPVSLSLDFRIERLLNYKRPWFKFFLGKAFKVTGVLFVIFTVVFLVWFYSKYGHLNLGIQDAHRFHVCTDLCHHN